jgi:hypothetical protein
MYSRSVSLCCSAIIIALLSTLFPRALESLGNPP